MFLRCAHWFGAGQTVSTVAEEKRLNTRLTKSESEFVDIMKNLNLPYPKFIGKLVAMEISRCVCLYIFGMWHSKVSNFLQNIRSHLFAECRCKPRSNRRMADSIHKKHSFMKNKTSNLVHKFTIWYCTLDFRHRHRFTWIKYYELITHLQQKWHLYRSCMC